MKLPGKIAVMGGGSWATAIAKIALTKAETIDWYMRRDDRIADFKRLGHNPAYLTSVKFDLKRINFSSNINDIVKDADTLIFVTPSPYLKSHLKKLKTKIKDKFIITAIKGIVPDDYKTVAEYLHDTYGLPYRQTGIIAGPSHAEEVSRGKLSYLTIVSADRDNAGFISRHLASESVRTSCSSDLYGAEYAAILKNIYAIAAGLADGLGYGDNFKAVLISGCAREMTRFLMESYPDRRDTLDPAYLGDLLVTCYSNYSRNRRLGLLIGRGCTVKSALNEMTMVAEGYFAADCIRHINFRHRIDMPIADMVYDILYRNALPRQKMKELAQIL